jgi:hypothetical protein
VAAPLGPRLCSTPPVSCSSTAILAGIVVVWPQADSEPPDDPRRIVEVIGRYVSLYCDEDSTFRGACPFCQSTSFSVRASFGTFHCFGCGAGGDTRAFLLHLGRQLSDPPDR